MCWGRKSAWGPQITISLETESMRYNGTKQLDVGFRSQFETYKKMVDFMVKEFGLEVGEYELKLPTIHNDK